MLSRRGILTTLRRFYAAQATNSATSAQPSVAQKYENFDISVALALYRIPVVAPPMTEVERRFAEVQSAVEDEQSLKSNFELKLERDRRLLEKRAKLEAEGKDLSQMDEEIGISSLQLMDDWKKSGDELIDKHRLNNVSSFEGTDPRSIRRKLDRRILLMVKQLFQPGQNLVSPWILPQRRNNGEPLIETVKQCICETVKGDAEIRLLGNAPYDWLAHRFPKPIAEKLGRPGTMMGYFEGVGWVAEVTVIYAPLKDYAS